jgi:hypothetical protein
VPSRPRAEGREGQERDSAQAKTRVLRRRRPPPLPSCRVRLIQSKITRFNDTLGEAENETVEYSLSSKNVKEIDGLRNQSNTQLLKVTEGLRGLGRARQGPLEGFRSIERVLAPLSRKPPIAETVKSDDADRLQQIKADVAARLAEKLWIPYLRVEQITYPEDAAAAKSTEGRRPRPLEERKNRAFRPTSSPRSSW